jgi:UDP-2-acetamido-3-amino-2,3-dideoxy-glucuronate N-acetyltransferase
MNPSPDTDIFIHPTAVVDDGARIGTGTRVWHFCHVMPGAEIGEQCILGQNVFVGPGVRLGRGVKVQNNVSLYAGVIAEDDVFIGPSAVLTNVINPRSHIERKSAFRPTHLRQGATIGANATIVCGVTLGAWSFVGAGAVVTRDVPDFGLVTGNPARLCGWMSRSGCRLHFDADGKAVCPETSEPYLLVQGQVRLLTESY